MKTYQIGEIFRLDDEYSARAEFCNKNNLMIMEIEKDNKGRRFQIQKPPEPTKAEIVFMQIYEKKQLLQKYKEDLEQVELFGMERNDYEKKKSLCAKLVLELRELEKVVQNG